MLTVKNIKLCYPGQTRLTLDIESLRFPAGSITLLLGKSGAGKTSLLRCITTVEDRCEGQVFVDQRCMATMTPKERAREIGFVFQQFNLFPHLTVLDNLLQPLELVKKTARDEALASARQALAQVDMLAFAHAYPARLSGGQQQRVALARALCLEPRVLVFDEPTASLDPQATQRLRDLLFRLRDQGFVIVVSSHDTMFGRVVADQIYLIEDGRVVEHGRTTSGVISEENQRIAAFLLLREE